MIVHVLLFIVGLVLIIVAGDRFVDASIAIAKKLGISEIIIGATIVSLGTTLPEVLVSTTSAFQGVADMAAGNAFGSIICNTSLIAGITQLFRPTKGIDRKGFSWRSAFFFGAGAVALIFGLASGYYSRVSGIILIGLFALYAYLNIRFSRGTSDDDADDDENSDSLAKSLITLVITAAALFIGAKLLVDHGCAIAEALGVPERVIGVTFVALGTSLPELTTAITSIVKNHGAVSVGNIIGANILNLVLVMGIPSTIKTVHPSMSAITTDLPIALGVMAVLTLPMIVKKRGFRVQGAVLVAFYFAYCIWQFAA